MRSHKQADFGNMTGISATVNRKNSLGGSMYNNSFVAKDGHKPETALFGGKPNETFTNSNQFDRRIGSNGKFFNH